MAAQLRRGKEYVVCVESQAYWQNHRAKESARTSRLETRFNSPSEPNKPRSRRLPGRLPPSKTWQTPSRQRKTGPRKQVAKTTPSTAKKDTPRFVTLRSIPSATVFRLGQEVGVTLYKVRLDKKRHMMTLKAKGYADTDVKVDSNTPIGTKTVILNRPTPYGARQTVSEHHLHRREKGWAWGPRETSRPENTPEGTSAGANQPGSVKLRFSP